MRRKATEHRNNLIDVAMETWSKYAMIDRTDGLVNDLLERIAGNDYMYDKDGNAKSDDPIIDSIRNMSNAKLRIFIREANKLESMIGGGHNNDFT